MRRLAIIAVCVTTWLSIVTMAAEHQIELALIPVLGLLH